MIEQEKHSFTVIKYMRKYKKETKEDKSKKKRRRREHACFKLISLSSQQNAFDNNVFIYQVLCVAMNPLPIDGYLQQTKAVFVSMKIDF